MRFRFSPAAAACAVMFAAAPLSAQDAPAGPTPEPAPICTDRPTKGTATCTVPKGMIQVESDAIFWTRSDTGGQRSDVLLYTNPTVKFGLTDSSDIQFNLAPLVEVRNRIAGQTVTQRGVGDLTVRFKQRLTDPGDRVQISVVPFVKLPTAERGIGDGEWEGGLVTSVQIPLTGWPSNRAPPHRPHVPPAASLSRGTRLVVVQAGHTTRTGSDTAVSRRWSGEGYGKTIGHNSHSV